jgi:hypothetical protein
MQIGENRVNSERADLTNPPATMLPQGTPAAGVDERAVNLLAASRQDQHWRTSAATPPRLHNGVHTALVRSQNFVASRTATLHVRANQAALPLTVAQARDAQVRGQLDAVRSEFAGPYRVGTDSVLAAPMFRMNGGCNQRSAQEHHAQLRTLCASANLLAAMGMCQAGRATPAELVKVTQLLIDHGHLPAGPAPVADRIKQMQWTFGIGLDCVGYTWQAVRASASAQHPAPLSNESSPRLNSIPLASNFQRHSVEQARSGDIIQLASPGHGEPGHNVVVYRNQIMDGAQRADASARCPSAAAFLSGPGPFHRMEVDSSWGAGPAGSPDGGGRRDTWLYDEGAKQWGFFVRGSAELQISTVGPCGERATGAYRPRGA